MTEEIWSTCRKIGIVLGLIVVTAIAVGGYLFGKSSADAKSMLNEQMKTSLQQTAVTVSAEVNDKLAQEFKRDEIAKSISDAAKKTG